MTTEVSSTISLQTLNTATEHSDVLDVVNTLLPKWIESVADKYAPEYTELEKTWHDLCKKINTSKNKILIVRYLPVNTSSENDQYISIIADMLVSKGYLLRRPSELVICPNTGQALISKKMFQHFKRYNNIFPKEWKPTAALIHNESDEFESEKSVGIGNNALRTDPSDSPVLNC